MRVRSVAESKLSLNLSLSVSSILNILYNCDMNRDVSKNLTKFLASVLLSILAFIPTFIIASILLLFLGLDGFKPDSATIESNRIPSYFVWAIATGFMCGFVCLNYLKSMSARNILKQSKSLELYTTGFMHCFMLSLCFQLLYYFIVSNVDIPYDPGNLFSTENVLRWTFILAPFVLTIPLLSILVNRVPYYRKAIDSINYGNV